MQVIADLLGHPSGRGGQRRFVLQLPGREAAGPVRDPAVPDDHLRHARQGPRRPAVGQRAGDRLRPDHARRQVSLGLGQLPGHVRPGAGPVGERQHLHPSDGRRRCMAFSKSAGRRSAPTPWPARSTRHDRQDPARTADVQHDRAAERAGRGAAAGRRPTPWRESRPRASAAAAAPASPPA